MTRPLSAEERALWRRVTTGIKTSKEESSKPFNNLLNNKIIENSALAARASTPTQMGTTLDHNWDRKLRIGAVEPDRVIDLHGLSLDAAHRRVLRALADAIADDARVLVLVTGKPPPKGTSRLDMPLRGIIRASVGDWIAASPYAAHVAAIRSASRRHGGDGAIYVVLRRKKRPTA